LSYYLLIKFKKLIHNYLNFLRYSSFLNYFGIDNDPLLKPVMGTMDSKLIRKWSMAQNLTLTYFSDILCVWAYISQARIDEVSARFADEVSIDYRFCSVFGDTAHNVGIGWANRGGYAGFGKHLHEVASEFDHIKLHPEIWQHCRPLSSTPAHILMKAVQRVDKSQCRAVLQELRSAFFERCLDIGKWSVLKEVLGVVGVSVKDVRKVIQDGVAHADMEADRRDQQNLLVQGSPTILLNEGRQKLTGNVGFRVIEANINELLCSKASGVASWC
jgi:predicted DsbA family dithiol-disulfide isomerase